MLLKFSRFNINYVYSETDLETYMQNSYKCFPEIFDYSTVLTQIHENVSP